MRAIVLVGFFTAYLNALCAAGPERIASMDRDVWPEKIHGKLEFDRASRFEIYSFTKQFLELNLSSEEKITEFTGITSPSVNSIRQWQKHLGNMLVENFKNACQTILIEEQRNKCSKVYMPQDILLLQKNEVNSAGKDYNQWKVLSGKFHLRYLYEQARLAALFERVTSEILKIDEKEIDGYDFNDREFLLTFDDGPSSNSVTKKMINTLRKHKVKGMFFVLGERFDAYKSNILELYAGQCVASHGYTHKAHPKYKLWKSSIDKTFQRIANKLDIDSKQTFFRPPYGQRNNEIINYIQNIHQSRIMLWNIDSQDWRRGNTTKMMTDRIITLSLLWRKGIILFHDLYPKSVEATKLFLRFSSDVKLSFLDCERSPTTIR